MFDVIIAVDKNGGIGKDGKLPWHIPEELKIFRMKTKDCIVIAGRKTIQSLPVLKNRVVYCVSRFGDPRIKVPIFNNIIDAVHNAKNNFPEKKIFIIGGGMIYSKVFRDLSHYIDNIHVSFLKESYTCDTFFNIENNLSKLLLLVKKIEVYPQFTHVCYTRGESEENSYIQLLKKVLENGEIRDGRNGKTRSLFAQTLSFDLEKGFPLLTTKKMFFRGIVEELLFFIRGETDSKILENKGINIWRRNTEREFLDKHNFTERKEGMMGPMYGWIWRFSGCEYDDETGRVKNTDKRFDQLQNVIDLLKNDPHSRRIIMTTYNPDYVKDGVLYPCHSLVLQFYVRNDPRSRTNKLDLFCYNRSSDLFLGLPFNIASTSLLLLLIGKISGYTPGKLTITLGDAHIYEEHLSVVKDQIKRIPYAFPQLKIGKEVRSTEDIERLEFEDFILQNYQSYPLLKAKMIA